MVGLVLSLLGAFAALWNLPRPVALIGLALNVLVWIVLIVISYSPL